VLASGAVFLVTETAMRRWLISTKNIFQGRLVPEQSLFCLLSFTRMGWGVLPTYCPSHPLPCSPDNFQPQLLESQTVRDERSWKISTRSHFTSPSRTHCNVWRHFWLLQLSECYLHLQCRSQERC
jgi:hypothetical protein